MWSSALPVSNLKTGAIRRLADLPLRQARAAGLSFSINTDDPGPFECSMESEYWLAAQTFGFDAGDLLAITVDALNARFQPNLRYIERIPA